MKKYWIIDNGRPIGPFSADDLRVRRDFTASLPVWYEGLPDWTTAGALPELASMLEQPQPQPQQQSFQPQGQQPFTAATSSSAFVNYAAAPLTAKKPRSLIIWNAILIFFCFIPGIIGVVYGMKTNRMWRLGNEEGALRASNAASWCLIIGIVLTLVITPFQIVFTLL